MNSGRDHGDHGLPCRCWITSLMKTGSSTTCKRPRCWWDSAVERVCHRAETTRRDDQPCQGRPRSVDFSPLPRTVFQAWHVPSATLYSITYFANEPWSHLGYVVRNTLTSIIITYPRNIMLVKWNRNTVETTWLLTFARCVYLIYHYKSTIFFLLLLGIWWCK